MAAIGVQEVYDQSNVETLVAELAGRDALIVLDNCEHVLAEAAALADALVRRCGRVAVLATSRQPLGVGGEVVWRVPCLSVPEEHDAGDIESLDTSEAVRLFIDRARSAWPSLAVTNENAPAVVAICQRLDGIPLAIELAAARTRMMSAEAIAEAIRDRFHLLTGSTRSAMPRQQTLRASVDWSHGLLTESERTLLRRLSVFAGGLTLDGAEHVAAGGEVDRYDVLGPLSALADKSLVQVNDQGDRYRLLETIKAYAAEELTAAGEDIATRDRHLAFFAELASRAELGMVTSAVVSWLAVLDAEVDNLRAALDWSLASEQPDSGARLLCAIDEYLQTRCLRVEGVRRCQELLAHDLAPRRRAELYGCVACLARYSDLAAALSSAEALVALGRELSDDKILARGLAEVGNAQRLAEPLVALTTLATALAISRAAGDDCNVMGILMSTTGANLALGRFREALASAEEAMATAQDIGSVPGIAWATYKLAQVARELGDIDRTAAMADVLIGLAEQLGDQQQTLLAHYLHGVVRMYRAEPLATEDLAMARQLAERTHDPMNLVSISYYQGCLALALALGQAEEGCRILEESIPLADAFAPIYGARLRCLLAEAAVRRADLTQARRWVDDTVAQPLVDRLDLARARCRLARARGGHHLARQLADEGLESARRCGAQLVVVDFLELLGVLAADRERCVEAGRLLGAAGRGRQRLGYVPFVMDRRDVAATIERIEAALGPSGRSAAWSVSGRGFLPRRGRRLRPPGTRPARPPGTGWASLTPTERSVVELVVDGLTNAEIGARMLVSEATVKSHLNHVFGKLDVANRRELAGAARDVMV